MKWVDEPEKDLQHKKEREDIPFKITAESPTKADDNRGTPNLQTNSKS